MPYYLEKDDRELIKKLRLTNVCAVCSGKLEALYDLIKHSLYLQCHDHPEHEGIAKPYHEPRELNILTRRENMKKQFGKETSTAIEQRRLPTTGALTQSQAMHILKLVYPEVPDDQIIRTAILCKDFGLHPLLKEIYIIPFGKDEKRTWSTVLGISATRKIMARYGSFSYVDNTPRVMTEKEQKTIFGEVQTDRILAITKLMTKDGLEAQGYGHYLLKDTPYGIDKGNTKANMAFIRSERQAFSRLCPDAIPQEVEVIDEAYVDVPDINKVEKITGEIFEAKVTELEPPQEAPREQTGVSEDKTGATTEIKTIQAFYNWVASHGKTYTRSWVLANIGMNEDEIRDDPQKAYTEIKVLMPEWED